MDFKDVMERIAIVIERNDGVVPYDKRIAESLNISPTNYANMKKRNCIPFEQIAYFCGKNKITMNWILLNQHCDKIVENEEKFYKIRLIKNINASCGGGAFDDESFFVDFIQLDKENVNLLGLRNTKNMEAIQIVGDSMLPTLEENKLVLIDRTLTDYKKGEIFLVNTTSGLFVKRLYINSKRDIDLVSDNELYATTTMSFDEVCIIGRVVGILE
jgi:repressor LexA